MLECRLCHNSCHLKEGQTGICLARKNIGGEIKSINYGKITSIALDPIEKKPLYHFFKGSNILSIGSFGCNLNCNFCQNHSISMHSEKSVAYKEMGAEEIVFLAENLKIRNNIGVAFTYNEPLLSYEFIIDTAKHLKERGLKTVCVSNGSFNIEPMEEVFELVDAWNIDLKAFSNEFYSNVRGDLETVKRFINRAGISSHIEITTLIIPGLNDNEGEIRQISEFIAEINPEIPYHISRYFPAYKSNIPPTPIETIYRLKEIALKYLKYVYTGNC